MEQSHSTKIPTPPSSRPSSLRRARGRYVNRLFDENVKQTPILCQEPSGNEHEINLQKYKKLPAIGSSSDLKNHTTDTVNRTFEKSVVGNTGSRNYSSTFQGDGVWDTVLNNRGSRFSTNHEGISKTHLSSQCDVDEQLQIAIRLPDGSRRENSFSSSSTFMHLLKYLINSSVNDQIIPRNCEFVTSEVPQQVFSDFNVTLNQAKLKTRTLLYLREVDPD